MASVASAIRSKVEKAPADRLWTFRDFRAFPGSAVAMTLSRLARKGVVRRLRKGVYYRPKKTRFGELKPDAVRVVSTVLDSKDVAWMPSGLAAWNALGLTTQISAVPTLAVVRRVSVEAPETAVRLRVVPTLRACSAEERAALDALRDLRRIPGTTPEATIRRLADLCRAGRLVFARMTRAAHHEPPRVRALLGLIGTLLREDSGALARLKDSLNPVTTFQLGLAGHFPQAANWNIR